ncbi:PH domain-containing protein [Trueperella bernardiae]|uniref:PH domain-containing protein n=1 Tax=Trueperella bernardiae TaxID=59561 RepID=UPI002949EDA2|nr:PH domain-containing protein [Trueperella bernardiae]MDV6238580.1 PH domain-containing protein [Trueperella bernardiae]
MSDKRTLGESVPEGAWRKFHKVTPLANGGVLWVALAIFLYNILQSLLEDGVDELRDAASHITLMWILIAAGALVLLTIVVVVCSWVVWRFASFAVVDSGIHHRSGVLIKRHKHMRWDRVQSVEVEQKIFGRIFGFGSVKVESAGSDEGITLGLLTMADCAALRKEVLQGLANARAGRPISLANDAVAPASTAPAATPGSVLGGQPDAGQPGAANQTGATDHAAGATGATGVVGPDHAGLPGQPDAGQPGETGQPAATGAAPAIPIFDPDDTELDQLIFEMPTSRLIASRLLSPTFLSVLTVALAMLVGSIWLGETLMAVIFLVVGSAYTFVKSSLGQYGTKVYLSANGLRVRGGLTTLTTRSIPPARLHAIELHRPMLWRWKDWWEVTATLAGAATLDTSGDTPRLRNYYPCRLARGSPARAVDHASRRRHRRRRRPHPRRPGWVGHGPPLPVLTGSGQVVRPDYVQVARRVPDPEGSRVPARALRAAGHVRVAGPHAVGEDEARSDPTPSGPG